MTKQIHPGEPSFDDVLIPTKIDIVNALNFYSANASEQDVRAWAKAWCDERGLGVRLRGRQAGELISLACFYRMRERGFHVDDELAQRLDRGFMALDTATNAEPVAEVAPKPKIAMHKPVECLVKLDAYLDTVIDGTCTTTRAPALCGSKKEVAVVREACIARAQHLQEDKDAYRPETYKALKAAYTSILKSLDTAEQKIQTEKTKAALRSKPPGAIARDVRYSKQFGKIKSQLPERMVGAKKAYVFDVADRKLMLYVATDTGFTFTGTTLKNIDTAKSHKKTIRNPEQLFDGMELTMSQLNKTYTNINAKEQPVNGRFSTDHVILCVGGH